MKDKIYRKITRKRFLECLQSIGWDLYHGGHGYYTVVNDLGEYTGVTIFDSDKKDTDEISDIRVDGCFGKSNTKGSCVFVLKGCHIRLSEDSVSIMVNKNGEVKQPAFLSFYNFNKR